MTTGLYKLAYIECPTCGGSTRVPVRSPLVISPNPIEVGTTVGIVTVCPGCNGWGDIALVDDEGNADADPCPLGCKPLGEDEDGECCAVVGSAPVDSCEERPCFDCGGEDNASHGYAPCDSCNDSGVFYEVQLGPLVLLDEGPLTEIECPTCGGEGIVASPPGTVVVYPSDSVMGCGTCVACCGRVPVPALSESEWR